MHQSLLNVTDFVMHHSITNFLEQAFSTQIYIPLVYSYHYLQLLLFYNIQWSSSHEERAKVIQEGLANPSADILEAMVETKATCKGRVLYLF